MKKCKKCGVPLTGFLSKVAKTIAKVKPSKTDEAICNKCEKDAMQGKYICQICGRTTYFEGDYLEPLIDRVAQESGYRIKEHWLQLFGFCAECRK